jgi:hypothetical protein
MTFILKVTENYDASPVGSDNPHTLYADVVAVNFARYPGGTAEATCWVREPVKTAEVPGFCEVQKCVVFGGWAYVMNEAGKTVSTFSARTSGDPEGPNAERLKVTA